MSLIDLLKYITNHPLTRKNKLKTIRRFLRWQIGSRILKYPIVYDFVEGTRLIVTKGQTSMTGNIYTGMTSFEPMTFCMHYLRNEDVMVDIGANAGIFSVLCGRAGAFVISIEPIPTTFKMLQDNIIINELNERSILMNIGLAEKKGELEFTNNLGATNRALYEGEEKQQQHLTVRVAVDTLDNIIEMVKYKPNLIKIDVEGFESFVIDGGIKTITDSGCNVVIMELNQNGRKFGFDDNEIHKKMISYGFEGYVYDPFTRTLEEINLNQRVCEDVIYIKNYKIAIERLQSAKKVRVLENYL